MKIVKRDGRIVEYNSEKIRIAISKANQEVEKGQRVSDEQIDDIIKSIENLDKKRMLVEDIQDIIEEKLMALKKFKLAKHYIIYRYTRALVRKSNTTDETILSIIKNNNEITNDISNRCKQTVSTQRDSIAGEISKDLTKRMLLPEKISKAHEEGRIYFHDSDYFLHPMFNSSYINIEDMLQKGTSINGTIISTPNSFQVACNVVSQIITAISSSQYGNITLDVSPLGIYLRKSFKKYYLNLLNEYSKNINDEILKKIAIDRVNDELISGVQTLIYQIKTSITSRGREPQVTFVLDLKDDEFIEENARIIEEILNCSIKGADFIDIKNTNEQPNLIFLLNEKTMLASSKYAKLTELAIKCAKTRGILSFISSKKVLEKFDNKLYVPLEDMYLPYKIDSKKYVYSGRFNQGVVTINLPRLGLESKKNESIFFEMLDETLILCFEALLCRHHALLGTLSDNSPIHFLYGAIARMEKNEKIDRLLKNEYSTLSIGYIGLYELTKYMTGVSMNDIEGLKFAKRVMKRIKEACDKYRENTKLGFLLYGVNSEKLCHNFSKMDREVFGSIKEITNKGYYTPNCALDKKQNIDIYDRINFEEKFADELGIFCKIQLDISHSDEKTLKTLVEYIYNNITYIEFFNGE